MSNELNENSNMQSIDRDVILRLREILQNFLSDGSLEPFCDQVHVLLCNNNTVIKEWIEVTTLRGSSIDREQNSSIQLENQNDPEALSNNLRSTIRDFIRDNVPQGLTLNVKLARNTQFGLGELIVDGNNQVQAFISLGAYNTIHKLTP